MENKVSEKVFCGKCKYFIAFKGEFDGYEYCSHPENRLDTYKWPEIEHKSFPYIINKNNNCLWFEEKKPWWKRLFK